MFKGQERCATTFSMQAIGHKDESTGNMLSNQTDKGTGNRLHLLDEEVLQNVRDVQFQNGIKQSEGDLGTRDFTIEMETGTGKTYVYLRSVFEMNAKYGFTKFIIVVPSIAVKEGVAKSLEMTAPHFKGLYDNAPFDYFVYDSGRLEQVRGFAANDTIQIMVINIQAFQRSFENTDRESKANVIHRHHDRMHGRPIDFIQSTNPIVIIDEPQSVDTTEASARAIASLNPLCTFRYSATHLKKHHMLYRLDPIDAYEQQLVKQIEVASIRTEDGHNKPYIKLLKVDNKKGFRAYVEVDVQQEGGVARKKKWVKQGADLLEVTNRGIYEGYIINDIYCATGREYIDFANNAQEVYLDQAINEVAEYAFKRLQIRKTIEEHLDKELRLTPRGIKVLSLFFIDKVVKYRDYDALGQKGIYAKMFEEEYATAIKRPKYKDLFSGMDTDSLAQVVHDGYFSKDTNGLDRDTTGRIGADEDTYNLIMKDKEKLLSFKSKLKFIFSHSALKEGWDNPNVFQICTLNRTQSNLKKRQEIGRGMRIAVNQDGTRIEGFDVNTLTVMANESYEDFAKELQTEIEEDDIIFGLIEKHMFARIPVQDEHGNDIALGTDASESIWQHLHTQGYINMAGKVTDVLRLAIKAGSVDLPAVYHNHTASIFKVLKKVAGGLNIKNNAKKKTIKLNKAIFESDDFKELWERVKYQTTYRVDFDSEALIKKCADKIKRKLIVGTTRFVYERARLDINLGGIDVTDVQNQAYLHEVKDYPIPDILSYLQNETNLKRGSIRRILVESGRLDDFKKNPQKFIDEVKKLIKEEMSGFIVDGIKYQKIGDAHFYAQELFVSEELIGYIGNNMIEAEKSAYDHVVWDSGIEKSIAEGFENSGDVKVYAKLPSWFKIDTPLGSYNPDWAVLLEMDGQERLYFVVETKGEMLEGMLRPIEQAKIDCGRAHFAALGQESRYVVADSYKTFTDQVPSGK